MSGDQTLVDRIRSFPLDGRNRRFVQYLLVGLVGIGINEGLLFLVSGVAGLSYVIGGVVGRAVSTFVNFVINDRWTWRAYGNNGSRQWAWRGVKYGMTRLVGIAIGVVALVVLVELFGLHYLVANIIAIGVGVLWGFTASDWFVWQTNREGAVVRRSYWTMLPERLAQVDRSVLQARLERFYSSFVQDRLARVDESAFRERLARVDRSVLQEQLARVDKLAVCERLARVDKSAVRERLARVDRSVLQEQLARVDRSTWYVVAFSTALFVVFSLLTVQLYRGYWTTGSDFGSYVHMFATTLDGQGFLIHGKYRVSHPEGSYWGAHFSLTLLSFLPLFALFRSPMTLLIAKSFLLASSVLALWFVARTHIQSDRLAVVLVLSYGLNSFLWSAWLFDFQEQALVPVLVFGAYYMYAHRRYVAFLALLTLTLLTNEFVIIVVGGALLGLAITAYRGGRLDDERWVLLAGLVLVLLTHTLSGMVIDQFSLYTGIPYASIARPFKPYIGARTGIGELLTLGVSNPTLILNALRLHLSDKLLYFVIFLVPVVFLSLNDEISLGALAPYILFSWFFAGRSIYYMFGAHYPLYLLPFLYIGAVRVAGRNAISLPSQQLLFRLFATVIAINIVTGVVVGSDLNVIPVPSPNDHTRTLETAIEGIPSDASILTQNDIYPHVAMRPNATYLVRPDMFHQYQREYGKISPEYVLYDTQLTGRPYDWSESVRTAFGDRLGTEYGLYQYQDGINVYKRGYSGPVHPIDDEYALNERFDAREFEVSQKNAQFVGDTIVGTGGATSGNLWFGPYVDLPPGDYTATYRVNVESDGEDPVLRLNVGAGHNNRIVSERTVGPTDGWENVTLSFTLDNATSGVEFRGAQAGGAGTVRLDSVRVVLYSPDSTANKSGDGTTGAGDAVDSQRGLNLLASPGPYDEVTSS